MKHTWNRKIPDIVLERRILRLSSLQIKSKTMMSCSLRKKKRTHFLYRLFCPNFFFDICVLCQCIVYWTHSYNLWYIKKHYFIHFFACFQNLVFNNQNNYNENKGNDSNKENFVSIDNKDNDIKKNNNHNNNYKNYNLKKIKQRKGNIIWFKPLFSRNIVKNFLDIFSTW